MDLDPYNPYKSVALLKEYHIQGKVFSWDGYGGYLNWSSYPNLKPFVDGRQANKKLYHEYIQIMKNPKKHWPQADKKYQFDIILMDANYGGNHRFIDYIKHVKQWQLISIQGPCVIFVKRKIQPLPFPLITLENRLINTPLSKQNWANISIPSTEKSWQTRLRTFLVPPAFYVDVLEESIALYGLGYREASLEILSSLNNEISHPKVHTAYFHLSEDYKNSDE